MNNTGVLTNYKSWSDRIMQLFSGKPKNTQQLSELIEGAENRELINEDTKKMMQGILEFSELQVRDLMIPRSQIITLEINQDIEDLLSIVIESAHSRFPIFDKSKDQIEGILLAKDLLTYAFNKNETFHLKNILRPATIVPESKPVDILLKEFRSDRYHMAIVINEYGSVSGLITIEDILEEIVGDIEDETDIDEEQQDDIKRINNHVWSISALTDIEHFNEHFQTNFSEENFDTIGGLINQKFGYFPKKGEKITLNNLEFKITNADSRHLIRLQVTTKNIL